MKKIILIIMLTSSFIFANLVFAEDDVEALTKERQMLLPKALHGDAFAQLSLGIIYYNGYGVDINYEEAAKWFSLSAEQGVTTAQFNLGYMYTNGQGVEIDNNKAIQLFLPSANEGNVIAQYNLGVIYYNGEGIKKDYVNALKWFTLAAIQNDENALFMLGTMYQEVQGLKKIAMPLSNFIAKAVVIGIQKLVNGFGFWKKRMIKSFGLRITRIV